MSSLYLKGSSVKGSPKGLIFAGERGWRRPAGDCLVPESDHVSAATSKAPPLRLDRYGEATSGLVTVSERSRSSRGADSKPV